MRPSRKKIYAKKSSTGKGSEKFWLGGGAEAVAQVCAARLSQDDRIERLWELPEPYHAYGRNWARIAA
jgi:hypothetical protein